jgi:hypothetical protein
MRGGNQVTHDIARFTKSSKSSTAEIAFVHPNDRTFCRAVSISSSPSGDRPDTMLRVIPRHTRNHLKKPWRGRGKNGTEESGGH